MRAFHDKINLLSKCGSRRASRKKALRWIVLKRTAIAGLLEMCG